MLEFDAGKLHANSMADFVVDPGADVHTERFGGICAVCQRSIYKTSTTCPQHMREWRRIKSSPRLLALWIARVAAHDPRLYDVIVWEAD